MPKITVLNRIFDKDADELMMYEPGVFKLVKLADNEEHDREAVLFNEYACTMSRNYMRNPRLAESLKFERIGDHFIFSVESSGAMTAAEIVLKALDILKCKSQTLKDAVIDLRENEQGNMDVDVVGE